jgi:hypothetical protein
MIRGDRPALATKRRAYARRNPDAQSPTGPQDMARPRDLGICGVMGSYHMGSNLLISN